MLEHPVKIVSPSVLDPVLTEARRMGQRIIFTNGCFDLLHPGHVQLLQMAKRLGDILVVGINTDASIRRLKGAGRPILAEHERAQMLAALDCVDYVVVFEEDTPIALLSLLRPDILVKGADYREEQVIGRDLVESYGGRVVLAPVIAGLSTTDIVTRILRNYSLETNPL